MLSVCATPIGNSKDISVRVLEAIKAAELVIGEEGKPTRQLLKDHGLTGRLVEALNEHTELADLKRLVEECKTKQVVLVSDCGTPGFCDPGADLIRMARESGVEIHALPGPSSLMAFLSICGRRLDRFLFDGFLPRDSNERRRAIRAWPKNRAVIVLETPYRLGALLTDLEAVDPGRSCVLALDLTQPTEFYCEGTTRHVRDTVEKKFGKGHKAEIVLMMEPI